MAPVPEITPAKFELERVRPKVRGPEPSVTWLFELALFSTAIVSLLPFRARMPLPFRVTWLRVPNAVADPAWRVPKLTVVGPVYELDPTSVVVPVPCWTT